MYKVDSLVSRSSDFIGFIDKLYLLVLVTYTVVVKVYSSCTYWIVFTIIICIVGIHVLLLNDQSCDH